MRDGEGGGNLSSGTDFVVKRNGNILIIINFPELSHAVFVFN